VLLAETFSKGLLIQYVGITIAATAAAAALFVFSEWRLRPLFNYALFRIAVIRMGTYAFLITNFVLFVMLLLLPFYFKDYLHYSNSRMGMYLGISPIMTLLIAPGVGNLSDRLGFRLPVLAGLCSATTAFALLALGAAQPTDGEAKTYLLLICTGMALLGISSGLLNSPLTSAMMGAAGPELRAQTSSLGSLTRNLGFMGGTALGALWLAHFLGSYGGQEMMLAARSEQIAKAVPLAVYQHSMAAVFWVCCALLFTALLACLGFPNRLLGAPADAVKPA
jgi:MFS family permease